MGEENKEIENFVRYSVRYQILLAQHVSDICNMKVYIFDNNGYFTGDNIKVEVIDGVRTIFKNGLRSVLSVAVQESFGSNHEVFLKFVDENVAQKDEIGLYVVAPVVPLVEEKDDKKIEQEAGETLKDLDKALEQLEQLDLV
jgi:hypothetical protein